MNKHTHTHTHAFTHTLKLQEITHHLDNAVNNPAGVYHRQISPPIWSAYRESCSFTRLGLNGSGESLCKQKQEEEEEEEPLDQTKD